jgi:hypothetical protein
MTAKRTIKALAAGLQTTDSDEWRRKAARIAWVKETTAAWLEAMRAMDDRCTEAVERLSEDAFDRLFDAEQAKVDAIRAEIDAVIERDLWPRHLYFGGV